MRRGCAPGPFAGSQTRRGHKDAVLCLGQECTLALRSVLVDTIAGAPKIGEGGAWVFGCWRSHTHTHTQRLKSRWTRAEVVKPSLFGIEASASVPKAEPTLRFLLGRTSSSGTSAPRCSALGIECRVGRKCLSNGNDALYKALPGLNFLSRPDMA